MTTATFRILAIGLLLVAFNVRAQEKAILDAFTKYHSSTPVEKVYLHTDKEVYAPGETLWFGAYLVEGTLHETSKISEVTYVELLDSANQRLVQLSLKMVNGVANGDISLGDSLPTGTYTIRGFTHYQRNFDPAFVFSKSIFLVDSRVEATETDEASSTGNFDFQYFPEGGYLVAGLSSAVAFKATDDKGTGVKVEGELVSGDGKIITPFKSQHLGMGRFLFTPEKGQSYQLRYRINGKESSVPIEEIKDKGSRLSVRQSSTSFTITGGVSPGLDINDCLVLGHVRGQVYLIARPEGREFIYAKVPHNRMPNGIIHLTMFYKGMPMQERLIFNENAGLLPKVVFQGENLIRRQQAKFQVTVSDEQGAPVSGKVSMAILGEDIPANQLTIYSYLNLFSDLKGVVENPGGYFNPANTDRGTQLDLLMMTQGWRRFDWLEVLENSLPEISYFAEKGFSIEGQLVDFYKREKPRPGYVMLSFLEDLTFRQEVETDEQGNFFYDRIDLPDTVNVILEAFKKGKKDKVKREEGTFIKIHEPETLPHEMTLLTRIDADSDEKFAEILSEVEEQTYTTDNVIELDEFVVSANTISGSDDRPFRRPSMLHGEPQSRMVMDSVPGLETYTNVFDMITGRLTGVQIRGIGPERRAFIRGTEATFLVDGVPSTPEYVDLIDPRSVEFVEVIGAIQASVYGVNGGVVAIYSRQNYVSQEERDPRGIKAYLHPGYYRAREFYTPNYDEMTTEESLARDLRTTQYWSGTRVLEDGKVALEYTNSDDLGNFVIYLEGITDYGEPFTGLYRFEVKDF